MYVRSWFTTENWSISKNADGHNWLVENGLQTAGEIGSNVTLSTAYSITLLTGVRMLLRTAPEAYSNTERVQVLIAIFIGAAVNATIFGQVRHCIHSCLPM